MENNLSWPSCLGLPTGTKVQWVDGVAGVVNQEKTRIEWADGQVTYLTDKAIGDAQTI